MRVVYLADAKEKIMAKINLSGLDRAAVLATLYNGSKPQGMGFLQFDPTPMTVEEARAHLKRTQSFDYLKGRVMKISLDSDELETRGYDRDNGDGAAQRAIDSLRGTNDSNNILIRAQHAAATQASIDFISKHLDDETTMISEKGRLAKFTLGLNNVADILRPKVEKARKSTKSPLE